MAPSTSFILSFALSSTFSLVSAHPIPSTPQKLQKRSAASPRDVGVGFGIAIGVLIFGMILFYIGYRRGKARPRAPRTPKLACPSPEMASPPPTFRPTMGRRTTTRMSGRTIAPSFRPGLSRSVTSLSGKTISSPTPIHNSTFTPSFGPVSEKPGYGLDFGLEPQVERKFQEFGPHLGIEQTVYELGAATPRRPNSARTSTTAKSMTKSEWLRSTYSSAGPNPDRKSFFSAYRKSSFPTATSVQQIKTAAARASLEEHNTRGSFEDWRSDYAPSRRMTHTTHRTTGSKSFFCTAAAEIEEQEREYAALAEALQIQFPEGAPSTTGSVVVKGVDDEQIQIQEIEIPQLHAGDRSSQDTLVSPISPMELTSLPGSPPELTSPTFPMPVVVRTSPTIDGSEWSYGSDDEYGEGGQGEDEKEGATMYAEKEAYAEKEGEEEMDWTGMEWLRRVYSQRRSRYMSGLSEFKTVYIGDELASPVSKKEEV